METNSTIKPSVLFNYWRPWNQDSNFVDSYFDFLKDTTLAKYTADSVGKYIQDSNEKQVAAINDLGRKIGLGFNILSSELIELNAAIQVQNHLHYIQIEEQKTTNLLLNDIKELLKLSDSEKNRREHIELGLKFFVKGSINNDMYVDALSEFKKAESLNSTDYFTLNKIGCLYLFTKNLLDINKAIEYYLKAAKYSFIEIDFDQYESSGKEKRSLNDDSFLLFCIQHLLSYLSSNGIFEKSSAYKTIGIIKQEIDKAIVAYTNDSSTNINMEEFRLKNENLSKNILEILKRKGLVQFEDSSHNLNQVSFPSDAISFYQDKLKLNERPIITIDPLTLTSESFRNAAFGYYLLGDDENAIKYQKKSVELECTASNCLTLIKYLSRTDNQIETIQYLEKAIDLNPKTIDLLLNEIDILNNQNVIDFVHNYSIQIENHLDQFYKTVSEKSQSEFLDLSQELKLLKQHKLVDKIVDLKRIEKQVEELIEKQKDLIESGNLFFNQLNRKIIFKSDEQLNELTEAFNKQIPVSINELQLKLENIKNEIEQNTIQIGFKFQGGIVGWISEDYSQGLIISEKDLGNYCWGCSGKLIGTKYLSETDENYGLLLTKVIANEASYWMMLSPTFFNPNREIKVQDTNAAKACILYSNDGYNDWFLPSVDEFEKIYNSIYNARESSLVIAWFQNLESRLDGLYWSRNEINSDLAKSVAFHHDIIWNFHQGGGDEKLFEKSVRASRKFKL